MAMRLRFLRRARAGASARAGKEGSAVCHIAVFHVELPPPKMSDTLERARMGARARALRNAHCVAMHHSTLWPRRNASQALGEHSVIELRVAMLHRFFCCAHASAHVQ
eukprot:6418811-Pyramimonas_sp.AAC.1